MIISIKPNIGFSMSSEPSPESLQIVQNFAGWNLFSVYVSQMNLNVKLSTKLEGTKGPAENLGQSWLTQAPLEPPLYAPLPNYSIEQWRVANVAVYTLFATSQSAVIFTFANQRFGEVCWHNMHIILYTLSLLVVVQFVTVMNINYYQRSKIEGRSTTQPKGVHKGGLGLNLPLSLTFYKNFITCAKEMNCFRILFACKYVDLMKIQRNEFACKFPGTLQMDQRVIIRF